MPRKEVSHLKEEGLAERKKLKELMDMYKETIDLARFTTRRFFPLHRQLQNLYKQNIDLQSQIRKIKWSYNPSKMSYSSKKY
jgi:hypothetical protein